MKGVALLVLFAGMLASMSCRNLGLSRPETEPGIAFLVLQMEHDSFVGKSNVSLVSISKTNGVLKKNGGDYPIPGRHLTIEVYQRKTLIERQETEHPLYKEIEYPNSDGILQRKTISLEKESFFIRVPYSGEHNYVLIFEEMENGTKNQLKKIEL
ncbi:MAG: hypothetical protein IPL65_01925 [Lewinellaceae bacterium]|nr:hypothetical protein [Lewinellaceae bacterium]